MHVLPLDHHGPLDRPCPDYPESWLERPVFTRFQALAERLPDHPAIHDARGSIGYGELLREALAWGRAIDASIPPGQAVALALTVDRHYPAAMLGALASGRPYVPLDLSFPAARRAYILAHSGVAAVLVDADSAEAVRAWLPPQLAIRSREALPAAGDWRPGGRAEDPAYILYTSGSTGQPKGVVQNQRGLTHDVRQYTQAVRLGPDDVLSGLYSPNVNGAIRDIFGALLNGATLCLFDLRRQGFAAVAAAASTRRITIFHAMPPVLRAFLREGFPAATFADVRLLYLAGDRLFGSDLGLVRRHFPARALVYAGIGSTECATLYAHWFIPPGWPADGQVLPVGRELPERRLRLIDGDERPVKAGDIGEVVVSSPFLAQGYWKDPALTASRFVDDAVQPGYRCYRTGDLARLASDGLLEFLGRVDRQFKIRGFRVEPAETEARLRELAEVVDVSVQAVGEAQAATLVAYVVLAPGASAAALAARLGELLPAHQCPARIVSLDALPTLGNYKLDVRALPPVAPPPDPHPAGDPVLARIREVWASVGGSVPIGDDTAFGDAGGDSLKALEFQMALERAFARTLPLPWFSLAQTPAGLARRLHAGSDELPDKTLAQLLIFPPGGGVDRHALAVADGLQASFEVHLLDYPAEAMRTPGVVDIGTIARQIFEPVRGRLQPGRPTLLLGLSYGGRIAYEMAGLLTSAGHPVELLIIGDIPPDTRFGSKAIDGRRRQQGRHLELLAARIARALSRQLVLRPFLRFAVSDQLLARLHVLTSRHRGLAALRQKLSVILLKRQAHRWCPAPYPAATLLLISDDTRTDHPELPDDLGWSALCARLQCLPVSGTHVDYFCTPASLLQAIAKARLMAARGLRGKKVRRAVTKGRIMVRARVPGYSAHDAPQV